MKKRLFLLFIITFLLYSTVVLAISNVNCDTSDNRGNDLCKYSGSSRKGSYFSDRIGDNNPTTREEQDSFGASGFLTDLPNAPEVVTGVDVSFGGGGMDWWGESCDSPSHSENCPTTYNPDQLDSNNNSIGDACEIAVLSPYDLKLDSMLKLESVKTDCEYRWWQWWKWIFNKKCRQNKIIDHVIGKIDSSLRPYLWIDDWHVSDKHGEKVFMDEYKAVKYMMAKKKQVPEEIITVFEKVTLNLVDADKLLACTIIEDAKNTPVVDPKNQEKVNRGIMDAESEFNKAEQSVTQENFDKAILHYKKAWEHAQLAIKFAKKEKEKCWLWWKCKEKRGEEKEEKISVVDAWGKFLDKVGGGYRER